MTARETLTEGVDHAPVGMAGVSDLALQCPPEHVGHLVRTIAGAR